MKIRYLLFALTLQASCSKAQYTSSNEIVILTVKDDRAEFAKAIGFLNRCQLALVGVNLDLTNCDNVKTFQSDHMVEDTLAVISMSEREKSLSNELQAANFLLLPSTLQKVKQDEYIELIGCGHLYPDNVMTGFVDLISAPNNPNLVEKFQIKNVFRNHGTAYHFAVDIAFTLNESVTTEFVRSHQNIVQVELSQKRKFREYALEDLYNESKSCDKLKGKIVILGTNRSDDYRLVSGKKLTTSEIIANIACQLVGQ